MSTPPYTSLGELCARYDALLFDAFGVLVDRSGPLPGAAAAIQRLNAEGKQYLVLSNSAARLPQTMSGDFSSQGLPITAEHIITSGLLLTAYFQDQGLAGSRCLVLGPDDSATLCRQAGGEVLGLEQADAAEVIIIADQKGFDVLEGMNRALTTALQRLDRDEPLHLVLCNPDLIYPLSPGQYGFTSGALAAMLERVLEERYPERPQRFVRLGKPHAPIFEQALRQCASRNAVMIGDQLATDIAGANAVGIDSALVLSGLARHAAARSAVATPTYLLHDLHYR